MNEFFRELQEENGLLRNKPKNDIMIPHILSRLDGLLSLNEYDSAERLLDFYLGEYSNEAFASLKATLLNEKMGILRKTNQRDKAFTCCEESLKLIRSMDSENTVMGATVMLNAATVYKHFGENDKAVILYRSALTVYEEKLCDNDTRLAGLYNNYALALTAEQEFNTARSYYEKALAITLSTQGFLPESAITCLNIADLLIAESLSENSIVEADNYVNKAMEYLEDTQNNRDGNYAFVCEKCAPVFEYYGYFEYAEELKERAKRLYEGT